MVLEAKCVNENTDFQLLQTTSLLSRRDDEGKRGLCLKMNDVVNKNHIWCVFSLNFTQVVVSDSRIDPSDLCVILEG